MKKIFIVTMMLSLSIVTRAQENAATLSGGYVFTNVEDVDADATGWRINGTYEFIQDGGKFAHGISFGYIGTKAEYTSNIGPISNTSNYEINSIPIYYAPKFMFGSETSKGFVKGAIGAQFSNLSRTGSLGSLEANDAGFYGGAGVGFMQSLGEKAFINIEYEWAYLSNSYYKDGFVNSVMLGVGFKF